MPAVRQSAAPASRPGVVAVLGATAATVLALLALAAAAQVTRMHLFAIPFAASAAIVAITPAAPFARSRSIFLGHLSAVAVGLGAVAVAGSSIWTAAVAAGLATAPMLLLRAPHPPATATAALVALSHPGVSFLLDPVLPACAVVVLAGILIGLADKRRRYPVSLAPRDA